MFLFFFKAKNLVALAILTSRLAADFKGSLCSVPELRDATSTFILDQVPALLKTESKVVAPLISLSVAFLVEFHEENFELFEKLWSNLINNILELEETQMFHVLCMIFKQIQSEKIPFNISQVKLDDLIMNVYKTAFNDPMNENRGLAMKLICNSLLIDSGKGHRLASYYPKNFCLSVFINCILLEISN